MKERFSDRPVSARVTPLADRAAVAIVGESRTDVAREALKIARAESQGRPVLLVDLLGHGSTLDQLFSDDDPHGVSDGARYGVSLARLARPVPDTDSLFVVPGGLESPLVDDVLGDHMWGSWSEQCRRAGALLVVAAPADLPAVGQAIDQLEGVVIVGDAAPPRSQAPLIGRVRSPRNRTGGVPTPRAITPEEMAAVRQATPWRPGRTMVAVALGSLLLVVLVWWAVRSGWLGGFGTLTSQAQVRTVSEGVAAGDLSTAAAVPAEEAAAWSVELASLNSLDGARQRVLQTLDSVPVPTFSPMHPGTSSSLWYRVVAGAFHSRSSADSLLAVLRARGVVDEGGGTVVSVPLGWLMEDSVDVAQLAARLLAWRQQGLPAYALQDGNGIVRIYAGAFATEEEGMMFRPMLDSLNLHATLTARVGSIR